MKELKAQEVKALAETTGITVSEAELGLLTIRLNGMLALFEPLDSLQANNMEVIPTLLTQRRD